MAIFLLAISAGTFAVVCEPLIRHLLSLRWHQVPCDIESAVLVPLSSAPPSGKARYLPRRTGGVRLDVLYRYEFKGRRYLGDHLDLNNTRAFGADDELTDLLSRYSPKSRTTCYVNPARPSQAILLREWPASWALMLMVAILCLMPGSIGLSLLKGPRRVR